MSDHIYCVYKHTSPSGKSYIGITNDYTLRCTYHQRADGSSPKFHRAIKKYGWDAFTHDIIVPDITQEAMELEVLLIEKYDTRTNGYNIHPGGGIPLGVINKGIAKTDAHRQALADSYANSPRPLETKIKAYMARHKKTRDEAEAYFEKKATDPASVNKYYNKPYVGYASTKSYGINTEKR